MTTVTVDHAALTAVQHPLQVFSAQSIFTFTKLEVKRLIKGSGNRKKRFAENPRTPDGQSVLSCALLQRMGDDGLSSDLQARAPSSEGPKDWEVRGVVAGGEPSLRPRPRFGSRQPSELSLWRGLAKLWWGK